MFQRHKKYFAICLSFLSLFFSSCSDKPNTSSTVSSSDSQRETADDSDIVITIATMDNLPSEVMSVINDLNERDNGYHYETKSYIDYYEGDSADGYSQEGLVSADFALIQDIINKDEIDIVTSQSFGNIARYEIMQDKGAFADLYQFMENDDEVNASTLNNHVLSLNEKDGKLCSIPTFYGISTLIGETKYVGSKENWTLDDFIDHWNAMPDNATINYDRTKEEAYYTVLSGNISSFIDYDNAEVHFDTPEFRRILEFCNSFEYNNGNKSSYDYDAPNFVGASVINGFYCEKGYYSDGEYTLVGYPSDNGVCAFLTPANICWSISEKSSPEKQMGAWELIRTFFTEEWLDNNIITYVNNGTPETSYWNALPGFTLNDNVCRQLGYDISDGKYYDGLVHGKEGDYYAELTSRADVDKLLSYAESIDNWQVQEDFALWQIVSDEVFSYFADEITLDECIDLIQNRASLWVSEQS